MDLRRNRRRLHGLILTIIGLVLAAGNVHAQGQPVVGLALKQHTGDITAWDYSPSAGLVATVSDDRCLKIWDAEDYALKATVNIPEAMSGGNLTRCMFHPFNHDVVFVSGNTASLVEDERRAEGKVFFFYAMDWKRNILLDKFGFYDMEVSSFSVSPDKNRILVSSRYEKLTMFDASTMAVTDQLQLKDEYIYNTTFLSDTSFVVHTDLSLSRYKKGPDGLYVRCGRISNRRNSGKEYLLSDNRLMFADEAYSDFTVKVVDLNRMRVCYNRRFRDRAAYVQVRDSLFGYRIGGVGAASDLSSMIYRARPCPEVEPADDEFIIGYEGESCWALARTGLSPTDRTVKKVPTPLELGEKVLFEGYDHLIYGDRGLYIDDFWIYPFKDHLYKRSLKGTYYEKRLPAQVDKMYLCPNPEYMVVSLMDGTLRFYDIDTGTEHLALFIDKGGDWIMWTPEGFYYSDDVRNGAMIEWRYQQFSQVTVRKPLERRERFFSLSMINKALEAVFTPEAEYETDNGGVLLNEFRPDVPKLALTGVIDGGDVVRLEYKVSDYDVFRYGPYDIGLEVDGKPYGDFLRIPLSGGGVVAVNGLKEYDEIMLTLSCKGRQMDYIFYYPTVNDLSKLAMVSCGVSSFEGQPDLRGTVTDAMDIDQLACSGKLFGVSPMDVSSRLLLDRDVTVENIRKALRNVSGGLDGQSLTIFYYSGHGVKDNGGYSMLSGDGSHIGPDEVYAEMASLPGKKLVIIDACYSELAVSGSYEDFSFLLSSEDDMMSIAGNDLSGSIYTNALRTEILSRHDSGESLSLMELSELVKARVMTDSSSRQTPVSFIRPESAQMLIVTEVDR